MRILVAHESSETRARIVRLSRSLSSSDVAVVSSLDRLQVCLETWRPELVLMSTPMAQRLGAHVAALPEAGLDGRAGVEIQLDPIAVGPEGASRQTDDQGLVTEELAAILLALADDDGRTRPQGGRRRHAAGSSPRPNDHDELSAAERAVLVAFAAGATVPQAADLTGIPEAAIDGHLASVLVKLHRRSAPTMTGAARSGHAPAPRTATT